MIAFNSVLRYEGKQTDPQAIGRELNVRAVLMGRLVQQGDNLSISTELIDVRDNRRLWGEQYDRKMSDLPLVSRELAKQITNGLRLRLSSRDQKQLDQRSTDNAEAYQLYLKGLYFWNKSTRAADEKAIDSFQQAIAKDPNYALAYVGLAHCYITMSDFGILSAQDGYPKARAAVSKALELDNTLAEAHDSLAKIKFSYDWDWPAAEQEYRRAMELSPNSGHGWYSEYLSAMGRHDQAIAESKLALELNPLSLRTNAALGWTLFVARQYDRAIEQEQKTIELEPNFIKSHRRLGLIYEQKRMYPEAIAEFEKVKELSHGEGGALALGHVYAVAGRRDEASKILDELRRKKSQGEYVSPYWFAMIYTGLGANDQAFEWLEQAYKEHDAELIALKVDPRFDPIRSDSRFADLLRRMNLAT